MLKNNKLKKFSVYLMSGLVLSSVAASPAFVLAETFTANNGQVDLAHQPTTTVDGPLAADGTLTVKGANQKQSIKNKKFMFYKVFDVENADANESVNYKFVEKYKESVQKVVMAAINKRDAGKPGFKEIKNHTDVSEYMAIDYIQSLNTHLREGVRTPEDPQVRESHYSAFRYFTEDLKNQIRKDGIEGDLIEVGSPDEENKIVVSGLSWGYYFVDEVSTGDSVTNGKPGTTEDGRGTDGKHFASSLVLVNTVNKDAVLQLKSDYPEIIKKINEDSDKEEAGNNGWNDIADYEIGQTVPYYNIVTVPNMNGYHGYYMAIQDKMDPALTFHADKAKVSIVLTDGEINKDGTITSGSKLYRLTDNEWKLSTHGENVTAQFSEAFVTPEGDTTFYAEIPDLKTIVDREFNRPTKENADENDYSNLKLFVTYSATLNEKAAEDTGRPGFENDVRLVFSNNPDTTGTGKNEPNRPPHEEEKGVTPWDTVVAFTYKLNGLKVNSNDYTLENAHFKLYADKEMTQEIFVKKSHNSVDTDTKTQTDPNIKPGETTGVTNTNGTDGETTNLQNTVDNETRNNNAYTVINRDLVGGTDHEGGEAPADAVTIVSDKNGNFSIVGLDSGTYYLKEVKAPKGYRLLNDPIELTIKGKFTDERETYIKGDGATDKTLKEITATGQIREFYDGIFNNGTSELTTHVEEGSVDVKIVNKALSELPNTGSTTNFILYGISGIAMTFGVYFVAKNKKSKLS